MSSRLKHPKIFPILTLFLVLAGFIALPAIGTRTQAHGGKTSPLAPTAAAQDPKDKGDSSDSEAAADMQLKAKLLAERQKAYDEALAAGTIVPHVAPSNDLCAGAEVIPAAGPFPLLTAVTTDITDATTTGDPATPSCQTSISRSIWYTFQPATTALYTFSLCAQDGTASTVDDTVLAVYTSAGGCAGPLPR